MAGLVSGVERPVAVEQAGLGVGQFAGGVPAGVQVGLNGVEVALARRITFEFERPFGWL